jgi:ABC-type uncharacterized transport system permease subunit
MTLLGWRLEKGAAPLWVRALLPVLAVIFTFFLTAALLVAAGVNPFLAFYYMLIEPLSAPVSALEVLVKATPLLLTGLAVLAAFRGGYYNIGAEGQLYAGALAAAWVGQLPLAHALPAAITLPAMIAAGFAAGMIWALAPALLRTRLAVDEVVTTLLLNTVMLLIINAILNAFWLDPVTNWPQSPRIALSAEFPVIVRASRVHLGLLTGLAVMVLMWWVLTRTPLGMKIRAVGLNREAAQFMGVDAGRMVLLAALVSGGIAGLAGVGEVAGIHHRLLEDISPGYGYSGIVIATLGGLNPFGAALAASFIALVDVGGQSVSQQLGVPTFLADIVQATILLTMLALLLMTGYRFTRVSARPANAVGPSLDRH